MARICMVAALLGAGGGLGGLGGAPRKVVKPERDNPVVCVAEQRSERE
jgi:hypothetical protein